LFPSFWKLQAVGWLGLYTLALLGLLPDLMQQPGKACDLTMLMAGWFLGSCLLRPICRSLRKRISPWLLLELSAFGCSATVGAAASALGLAGMWYARGMHRIVWVDLTSNATRGIVVLFFWCTLYFSIKQWQQSVLERERLLRAEADARAARLDALRHQLNPHFLFNSLNAVVTLMHEDATAAAEMLVQISDLLRTSLDDGLRLEVPLSQEMILTERYLAIERVRLGERLRVDVEIQAEALHAAVPSLLLQPLVENAVRHGVAPSGIKGGRIAIRGERRDSRLRLTISNTGTSSRDAFVQRRRTSNGIGLANTIERLRGLYGDDHSLGLQWPDGGGCEVTIELPFRTTFTDLQVSACVR